MAAWMCQENKLMTCNDGRWLVRGDACAKPCEKECPSPEVGSIRPEGG